MSVIQRVGDQDVVLVDKLVPPSQEDLILFIRTLRTALLSYNLYPPGHAVTHRRMGEFIERLMPMFRGVEVLVIACTREGLEVNDTQILQNVPEREVSRELSSFLELRGVRNLVVHCEVTFEELEDVFTRWVKKSNDSRTMHSAWKQGLQSNFLRFNLPLANRNDAVINDGLSAQPIDIPQEAIIDALSQAAPAYLQGEASQGEVYMGRPLDAAPSARPARVVQQRPSQRQSYTGGHPMPHTGTGNHPMPHTGNHPMPHSRTGNLPQHRPGTPPGRQQHPHQRQTGQQHPHSSTGSHQINAHHQHPHSRTGGHRMPHSGTGSHQMPHSGTGSHQMPRQGGHPHARTGAIPRAQTGGMAILPDGSVSPAASWGEGQHTPEVMTLHDEVHQGSYQTPPPRHGGAQQGGWGSASMEQAGWGGAPSHSQPQMYGTRNRAADAFSTGQFSPEMQQQLQQQQEQKAQLQAMYHNERQQHMQMAPHDPYRGMSQSNMAGPSRAADAFSTGQFSPEMQRQLQAQQSAMSQGNMSGAGWGPAHSQSQLQPYGGAASSPQMRGATPAHSQAGMGAAAEPQFEPFNPFGAGSNNGNPSANRGADAFSTGQFGSSMQEQLRAQQEQLEREQQAKAADPLTLNRVAVDPEAFDRRPPPFSKLDYRQIDPLSLFQSRRFQEFLARGGSAHYLSVYVPRAGGVETPLGGGAVSLQPWMGTDAARELLQAVDSLPQPKLKQQMLTQAASILSKGSTQLIEEQLMRLGTSRNERFLCQEVLGQVESSQVAEIGQRLLRRMVRAEQPEKFDQAGTALQALVDMQRKRNDWTPLVATLESLKRLRWDTRSEQWVRDKSTQMINRMVSARVGQQLLYQALCGEQVVREQTRYGLVAMGVDAAPVFVESLRQLQRRKDLEAMLGLLQEVSSQLSTQQKRLFYGRLWAERSPLDDRQQIVMLKAMQKMAPDTLEKFLLKEIRFAEEQGEEDTLLSCVRQAVLFHTPGIRQILLDFLRSRRFALYQEIEENVLRILDRHGTVNTVGLLDEMIHNSQMNMALRASAAWLLGSLKRNEALQLLSQILTARTRFWRKHKYAKELRLQALDSLRHFQWQGIDTLLERVSKDSDRELRQFGQQMLEEQRGFSIVG